MDLENNSRLLHMLRDLLDLEQMINIRIHQDGFDAEVCDDMQQRWCVLVESVLVDGRNRYRDNAQAEAGMDSPHKLLRMRVHQDQMISWLHLDLVFQIHGDGSHFRIELLPINPSIEQKESSSAARDTRHCNRSWIFEKLLRGVEVRSSITTSR
jgi:hypothetical protein